MCDEVEGPSAFREQNRKARKEHVCMACREVIRVNDHYVYTSGVWDGRPDWHHHCLRCYAMIRKLQEVTKESVDLELSCGYSWEEVFETPPPEDMLRWAFMTPDEAQRELR